MKQTYLKTSYAISSGSWVLAKATPGAAQKRTPSPVWQGGPGKVRGGQV